MTLDQAIPIVEGKLYAWGSLVLRYPAARIAAYDTLRVDLSPGASEPERWVLQHDQDLVDASRIEAVLKRLPEHERRAVRLRYSEHWPWRRIAKRVHMSDRDVYHLRRRLLWLFAYEFGLLADGEAS